MTTPTIKKSLTLAEASTVIAPELGVAPRSRPCPFCGDERRPSIEEVEMKYDPPNMWRAVCMCCGAEAPMATTRGAALIMWDERRQPGDTRKFCELSDRLSGFANTNALPRPAKQDVGSGA